MPRQQPQENEGEQYIQFRGPQTSVTVDAVGVHFGTVERHGRVAHAALPVVDDDDLYDDDTPPQAVAASVADALVESNPQVCYGVACSYTDDDNDVCGAVFETPQAVASHQSAHGSTADDDGDANDTEGDTAAE